MNQFDFYLEFDGKRTDEKAYDAPTDKVMAMNIRQAIEKICKRKKLAMRQYEALTENTFRCYLIKKAFLKADREYVYYIERKQPV
ncbi:MAG TPA: hypothetical protein VFH42_04895 [Sporolactobacillaceae bacterium]|nr:hypothetical protein [Sporolactobacillaceae bacterium]